MCINWIDPPGGSIQTHQGGSIQVTVSWIDPPGGVDPDCINRIDPPVSWIDPPVSKDFPFKKGCSEKLPREPLWKDLPGSRGQGRKGAEDQTLR